MNTVHLMWLFVASLLLLIGISFCADLDCHHEANFSAVTVSSSLNLAYGKENINGVSNKPWVGESMSSPIWVSVDFPNPVYLKSIKMSGGEVDLFSNNTLVKCHVDIFLLHYKTSKTGSWIRKRGKFKNVTVDYNASIAIKDHVTSINVTIKKYIGCPAIQMIKFFGCGDCAEPALVDQNVSCTNRAQGVQQCMCKTGLVSTSDPQVVKTCLPDGSWSRPDLTCVDENECTKNSNICGKNANCMNTLGSYKCPCKHGYNGNPCKDVDECISGLNTCHKSLGKCQNTDGSYKCQCKPGYSGNGVTCTDVNECSSPRKCHQSLADCRNTVGSYICQCKPGYTGNGVICEDVNECSSPRKCHQSLADCRNTVGSYICQCKPGYTGNGVICEDINECNPPALNPCHKSLATCENTAGSYKCQCKPGYTGNGVTCTDVNECKENRCPRYANCTNTEGSFNCTCLEGFSDRGGDCKGDPVTITSIFSDKEIRFGKALNEECKAKGLPMPRITWSTPNKTVSGSTLDIRSLTLKDNGVYTCIASNNDTTAEKTFTVVVNGKPTNVRIVTIDKTSATSIRISWRKPSEQGASSIKGYKICHTSGAGGSEEKCNDTAQELYTGVISDLMPNTKYFISVVAMNEQGNSEKKNKISVFTLGPKPEKLSKPQMKSGSTSSSTVKIQVKKLNTDQNALLRLQVIVQKVSQRRKRNTDVPSGPILGYDKADCKEGRECFYITAELENNEADFIVGDGKMYDVYTNVELEPATIYNIYVRGVSYNNDTPKKKNFGDVSEPLEVTTTATATTSTGSDGSVVGIAVGLTVLFVVLIVLVLLAVIYFRSRRPKTVEIDPETGEKKGRKKNINSELLPLTKKGHGKRKSGQVEDGLPDPNHPPVPTAGFAKYVGKLHKSDDRGFMIQYNTLETSQTYTSEIGTIPENKEKNRYANIVAYDVSRVHLKQIDDDDNSSYINASLVDGYNSANAYIATQGPLPDTFNDFWRMVWEKNCSSIVMLTNLQERHKLKCHKYWPEESETYGEITVTATRKEQYADYVIRTFLLKMNETEEEREIKQFHFTVWPDHGVPEYPTAILAFQRRVRAYSTRDSGTLAVHCSAGVGRSGTFIVIDCMLARIQSEQTIDIYNYVRYLRTRRMFMVQTEEQYVFCHDALLESILCGNTQMAAHNLRIEMNKLRQKDATTKMTGFESEFKILDKVSPSLPKESFVVASYPQNASKNRYNDILASDHGRVMLGDDDDNDEGPYINAVYIDGYKQQNAFILTQAPLKETIKDLWQMLYEKRSACVLLLTDLTAEEGDSPQFWPEEGSEEYDEYLVEMVSDVSTGDTGSEDQFQLEKLSKEIVERKFRLTKAEDKPLVVKMFHHLSWTETSVPTDISAIISLIQRIEKWQQRSGNGPITVICNDGQGRSGTFAALCSVLERVKTEQVVDVFQTIKALRIQRPGLVKHVDQYEFIHFGVQEYLDSFADYANFK